jgi:hypothetical protein
MTSADKKVWRFHVTVYQIDTVYHLQSIDLLFRNENLFKDQRNALNYNKLKILYRLKRNLKDSFQWKFPTTQLKKIFKAGPQQLHGQCVILFATRSKIVNLWYSSWGRKELFLVKNSQTFQVLVYLLNCDATSSDRSDTPCWVGAPPIQETPLLLPVMYPSARWERVSGFRRWERDDGSSKPFSSVHALYKALAVLET